MNKFYVALLSNGKFLADPLCNVVTTKDVACARRYATTEQLKCATWLAKVCYDFQLSYEIKEYEIKEELVEVL